VLAALSGEFETLYSHLGRPSIPPERLLRALLLQAFYSIRSERQLMEQLDYNLLFRWFVGLGLDDPVWHPTAFTTNRDRLLAGDVAARFLAAVLAHPEVHGLLSREHFTVDGTLVEAWASLKSFRPKDGADEPPEVAAMPAATSMVNGAPMTATARLPTRTPGCSARAAARKPSCASWAMC
jgi:transposase